MGNDSGELGHNIMDHQLGSGAGGKFNGFNDKYYTGRRPNGFYIPRFRNIDKNSKKVKFLRGYGYQGVRVELIGLKISLKLHTEGNLKIKLLKLVNGV